MDRIYLLLGTNIGDKSKNLRRAITLLEEELAPFLISPIKESTIYQTAPWGFEAEEDFLNQAIAFDAIIEPSKMLIICKKIETEMGRINHPERFDTNGNRIYESRIIDIDILLFGNKNINLPDLIIPHPRLMEREFALIPLRELLPLGTEIK